MQFLPLLLQRRSTPPPPPDSPTTSRFFQDFLIFYFLHFEHDLLRGFLLCFKHLFCLVFSGLPDLWFVNIDFGGNPLSLLFQMFLLFLFLFILI
jgi:hypothetical protein